MTHPQPINIEPTNPRLLLRKFLWNDGQSGRRNCLRVNCMAVYSALLIERIQQLEADIQELKTRVNWLILAIVGACLTFIAQSLRG